MTGIRFLAKFLALASFLAGLIVYSVIVYVFFPSPPVPDTKNIEIDLSLVKANADKVYLGCIAQGNTSKENCECIFLTYIGNADEKLRETAIKLMFYESNLKHIQSQIEHDSSSETFSAVHLFCQQYFEKKYENANQKKRGNTEAYFKPKFTNLQEEEAYNKKKSEIDSLTGGLGLQYCQHYHFRNNLLLASRSDPLGHLDTTQAVLFLSKANKCIK